jgi:hypothetical protein
LLAPRLVDARSDRVGTAGHRLHLLAPLITPPYQVGAFGVWRAVALIAVTAGLGYLFGCFTAATWNRLQGGDRR